jgi:hypothetical protein
MSVVPDILEAGAKELLELRSFRPAWTIIVRSHLKTNKPK